MARNEEKQQGRLNRLWLQRERDEGRLRDPKERRPRLSALTSASMVKKWLPSIKAEIEFYLQQSQLAHYPERKIAEFQIHIEALQREYKSFISKLRVLDPTCTHTPWTPRAYCKRRADSQDGSCPVKSPHLSKSPEGSADRQSENHYSCNRLLSVQTEQVSETADGLDAQQNQHEDNTRDQNQPLNFDLTRLAVAAVVYRGSPSQLGHSQTQTLAQVLHSRLPNLSDSNTFSLTSSSTGGRESGSDEGAGKGPEQDHESDCGGRNSGKLSISATTEKNTNVLGLDCYSSSSEEDQI